MIIMSNKLLGRLAMLFYLVRQQFTVHILGTLTIKEELLSIDLPQAIVLMLVNTQKDGQIHTLKECPKNNFP